MLTYDGMILYRLSFFKYIKEKVKEILLFSGKCKGDIFLNPAMKSGQDILREHYHDAHIIHAIKYFSAVDGYGKCYVDLNAGYGEIATEVASNFTINTLYEQNILLRDVLKVNMSLKAQEGHWNILSKADFPQDRAVVRCETMDDLRHLLKNVQSIIIFQNRLANNSIAAPNHDIYRYSASMDKKHPLKTFVNLILKAYAFKLIKMDDTDDIGAGDYIYIPKDQPL